jgi:DNA-binding NarL/FixJ family response regulator
MHESIGGNMLSVLILDSQHDYRQWLLDLLSNQRDFEVVGVASTLVDGLELVSRLAPELVLLDFNLPDGDSIIAAREIIAVRPQAKVVFLTENSADEKLLAAIQSGAKGYLLKSLNGSQLLASLRGLNLGQAPISRSMMARLLDEIAKDNHTPVDSGVLIDQLTARELEVLSHLAIGGTNRDIAGRLFVSEYTIKNHVHSILEKLHVSNRREAIKVARQHGLVDSEP